MCAWYCTLGTPETVWKENCFCMESKYVSDDFFYKAAVLPFLLVTPDFICCAHLYGITEQKFKSVINKF
jgi:hypothetical protein